MCRYSTMSAAELFWRFIKLLAEQLVEMGPVCEAQICDNLCNGLVCVNQKPGGFLHSNGGTILKQVHTCVFVDDAVEIVAGIIQFPGQRFPANPAVGFLHSCCDLGEYPAFGF